MHVMGKLGLEETLTIKKTFFNLNFKCQQNNNLSVFNVQIIRLYSLGSWNLYVPDNFKIEASTEVSTTTLPATHFKVFFTLSNHTPVKYHKYVKY